MADMHDRLLCFFLTRNFGYFVTVQKKHGRSSRAEYPTSSIPNVAITSVANTQLKCRVYSIHDGGYSGHNDRYT